MKTLVSYDRVPGVGFPIQDFPDSMKKRSTDAPRPAGRLLSDQDVLVIGLGASGRAACHWLRRQGAAVTVVDSADTEPLRREVESLRREGVNAHLGIDRPPTGHYDLAVTSPGVPTQGRLIRAAEAQGTPVISELELGYRHAGCPNIAITGTNGKTTTTELVERVLTQSGRKTVAAGNIGLPLCAVVDQTPQLDWLTLEVSSFQLETIERFRPTVAVLLNLTPDHLDRYDTLDDYYRAKARIFMNQQRRDWAIIQAEALRQLRALGLSVPAQVVTFSAHDSTADLYCENGWLRSRWPGHSGPLFQLTEAQLCGAHNAENLLAALAVGLVLGLPLEEMTAALKQYAPAPHRCELVLEVAGIQFVNDSKATNVDAVRQALLTAPRGRNGKPNVWLIAGGKDKGFDYQELGPVLSQRVKGAFLLGETREKLRTAWGRFTPCTVTGSLLEAVTEAARRARSGEVVLLSPACSSFDMFQNYQHRGEVFRHAVQRWACERETRFPAPPERTGLAPAFLTELKKQIENLA